MLQSVIISDMNQINQKRQPFRSLLTVINSIDNELEAKRFNDFSSNALNNFLKPTPIYYENHQVGLCKGISN